jgi:hypothetical protein
VVVSSALAWNVAGPKCVADDLKLCRVRAWELMRALQCNDLDDLDPANANCILPRLELSAYRSV